MTSLKETKQDARRFKTLADAPEILRARELARYLRVSPNKVYEMLESAKIPAVRYGRNWIIPTHAVIRWLETIGDGGAQSLTDKADASLHNIRTLHAPAGRSPRRP